MSNPFFRLLKEEASHYGGGCFSVVLSSSDPSLTGQKAFSGGIHPIPEQEGLSPFWADFFQSLAPETALPAVLDGPNNTRVFLERLGQKPQLVLLGGGHVAYFVYQLGIMLGFQVTVADDRREFCCRERFPKAAQLFCMPFAQAFEKLPSGKGVFYVVVTRGHQYDTYCAEQILKKNYSYFGMIGSRRKVALVKESLAQKGFLPQQIDSIFAPIGLPIGAQTPEEIAVSIMAEIIQQKSRQGFDSYADDEVFSWLADRDGPLALCMIISKSGSIPRGPGAKMAVAPDGSSVGSIGGGKIEFEAVQEAAGLCVKKQPCPVLRTFHMDGVSAEAEGMVCGGSAEVYIEVIQQQFASRAGRPPLA